MSAKTTGSYKGTTVAGNGWYNYSSNVTGSVGQYPITAVAKPYEVVLHCKGKTVASQNLNNSTSWIGGGTNEFSFASAGDSDIVANAALGALRTIIGDTHVDTSVKRVFVHFELE